MRIKPKRILIVLAASFFLASCGDAGGASGNYGIEKTTEESAADTEASEEKQAAPESAGASEEKEAGAKAAGAAETEGALGLEQFVILDNEMDEERLTLKQIDSGKQYQYHYTLGTRFLDKYGNRATVSNFVPGRVIAVREQDYQGNVLEVQMSDKVWEYSDVTRYSVDEERGMLKIGEDRYSYDEELFVYADGEAKTLSDLTEMDTIRLVGVGKRLLSIAVTTGHGELALKNAELFEGSFIQVGSKIFAEITPDMTIEVPEGTHTVTVANNGYGGSADVTIENGGKTELDLEELKGEGPKLGNILFAVDVEGASLQIDGEEMDYSEPIPLQYGVHTLAVSAEEYDTFRKKLFVNSEEATIVIELTSGKGTEEADGDSSETSETEETGAASEGENRAESPEPGSLAGSLAGSQASSGAASGAGAGTGGTATETDSALTGNSSLTAGEDTGGSSPDYLSTLSELLSILTGENQE